MTDHMKEIDLDIHQDKNDSVRIAIKLLDAQRIMEDPSVIDSCIALEIQGEKEIEFMCTTHVSDGKKEMVVYSDGKVDVKPQGEKKNGKRTVEEIRETS